MNALDFMFRIELAIIFKTLSPLRDDGGADGHTRRSQMKKTASKIV